MDTTIRDFFRKYERHFNDLDFKSESALFADTFISAGPRGVIAQNKAQFVEMGQKAADFYRSVGQKEVKLMAIEETPITAEYTMAKTHWGAWFEKAGDEAVEFDVTYILQRTGGEPKILMFITHQDEEKAMQELGLLSHLQGV